MLHFPVLLEESVDFLLNDVNGHYIDCTFGRGGHSKLILENSKLEIKPSMIQPLKEIKSLGKFKVKIYLHSEVDAEITINVASAETIQ